MKDKWLFYSGLAANIALLSVCLFYRGGGPLLLWLMPLLHILLFPLNTFAGKTRAQTVILGVAHIIATFCVYQQSGWLYFHYICDDGLGRTILAGMCLIGVLWTCILLIISLVLFPIRQKKCQQNETESSEG